MYKDLFFSFEFISQNENDKNNAKMNALNKCHLKLVHSKRSF